MQKGEENHYKGTLKAMEFSGVIGTAPCTVVPFEMHLIANRKEQRERQQCERLKPCSHLHRVNACKSERADNEGKGIVF